MKARPGPFTRPFTGRRLVFSLLAVFFLAASLGLAACGDFTPTTASSLSPSRAVSTMAPTTGPAQTPTT